LLFFNKKLEDTASSRQPVKP